MTIEYTKTVYRIKSQTTGLFSDGNQHLPSFGKRGKMWATYMDAKTHILNLSPQARQLYRDEKAVVIEYRTVARSYDIDAFMVSNI